MKPRGKRLTLIGAGLSVFVLLMAGSLLLAPAVLNFEPISRKIAFELSRSLGMDVSLGKVRIALFPWPRLTIHEARASKANQWEATAEAVTVVPRFRPLLEGRLEAAEIRLQAPEVTAHLSGPPGLPPAGPGSLPDSGNGTEPPPPSSTLPLPAQLFAALAQLTERWPTTTVVVRNGRLTLLAPDRPILSLRNLDAHLRLSPHTLSAKVSSQSDHWRDLSVQGWIDPAQCRSHLTMQVNEARTESLTAALWPDAGIKVTESSLTGTVTLRCDGPESLTLDLQTTLPTLTVNEHLSEPFGLESESEEVAFRDGRLDFSYVWSPGRHYLTLNTLNFSAPQLTLSGEYLQDANIPVAQLELKGHNLDVASVRKAALALAGRDKTVRQIFAILVAGHVPDITFSAQGASPSDLRKAEGMVLAGNLVEGSILAPSVYLEVEGTYGDVTLSGGILEAKNMRGHSAGSCASNGYLRIGLIGKDAPFQLDLSLDANLAELPGILDRVVRNDAFQRELALFEDVEGRAVGRLILGESLSSVQTTVDIDTFDLRANYRRLPFPFHATGGPFRYAGEQVSASLRDGGLGRSRLSGVAVTVDWSSGVTNLDVATAASSTLSVDEIYPWILSHETASNTLRRFESGQGTFTVESLTLKGPARQPNMWRFDVKGTLDAFGLVTSYLPGPLKIGRGRVTASRDHIGVTEGATTLLDASGGVSATFNDYLEGLKSIDLTLHQVNLGEKAAEWISSLIQLPTDLRVRAPLTATQSRFGWERGNRCAFTGALGFGNGTSVGLDVLTSSDDIQIRKMAVKDDMSDATMGFSLKNRQFDVTFAGKLQNRSLDRIFARNTFFSGFMAGMYTRHVDLDHPQETTGQGHFEVEGFRWLWGVPRPLAIERASIEAQGGRLVVKSAQIDVWDSSLTLKGQVDTTPEGFLVDADVSAGTLHWAHIKEFLENPLPKRKGDTSGKPFLSARGTLRVRSDHFMYDTWDWSPVAARVNFDTRGQTQVEFQEAVLCGIATPGTMMISTGGGGGLQVQLTTKPSARQFELNPTLTCLWNKEGIIAGKADVSGDLKASTQGGDLSKALNGPLKVTAGKGRVYRFNLLAKIFAILNVAEIFRGTLPDLAEEGCAYDSISLEGKLENGKFVIERALMDSPNMKMAGEGHVDLATRKADLVVLVSPLRTLDRIVGNVPVLGKVLGGSLISIPVQVSGDIADPDVIPLSPTAVSSGLLSTMKRIMQLPVALFQPLK